MADQENIKLMADQLKKDRKKTLSRLVEIAKTNTQLAKDSSDPKERKEALKKASKAAKARDALLKQDLSTAGAVKKEFGNIGTSLLGGFDGMLGEAFGPLGGIASTLTTGLVRRKIESKKNLDSDILQEETSSEIADTLEGIETDTEETSKETKEAGGETEENTEDVVAALGGVADASQTGYEDVELGLWTKMEDHLFFMRSNMETAEGRRERMRMGGDVVPAAGGDAGGEEGGGGLFKNFKFGNLFKKGGIKKLLTTLTATFGTGLKTAFAGVGKTFLTTIGPQLLKAVGPLALIAGIALAIKDGIAGFFLSDEWGVSKTSAVMGSVLGGTGSGWSNAFANAGKWALIGVGIGMIGGPVGMLIGGLVGAAIGGILGFIGGENLSKGFDKIGEWFTSAFDTVVDAISAVWHAVMPSWFTSIDFAWTDIFPTGLVKLFTGEYFTVDVPSFHWYSLFPKFLVDFFKGTGEKLMEQDWSWSDIFPKFLRDFFSGDMAKDDYVFSWRDLIPTWILKVVDAGIGAAKEIEWSWKSLLPDFIANLIDGVKIKEGSFEWTDLLPGWITKIVAAGKAAGTTETGEFDWTRLLPDWMVGAWDSTKAIGKRAGEGLSNLGDMFMDSLRALPDKLIALFNTVVDSIVGLIPGFGPDSAGEKSEETLKKLGLFVENLTTKDTVDIKGMQKNLETGAITKADIANMMIEQGEDQFSAEQFKQMTALVGKDEIEQAGIRIAKGNARGGIIVNRPSYLPSTGTVVGEHGTWSGKGAARGGIPMDGGPEAIIPLTGNRAQGFIAPIAASIAGQVMNNLAMDRVGMGSAGASSAPTVIDSSSQQVITNNTIVNSPEPTGPMLPGAGRDTAVSHFRHVA